MRTAILGQSLMEKANHYTQMAVKTKNSQICCKQSLSFKVIWKSYNLLNWLSSGSNWEVFSKTTQGNDDIFVE